MPEVPSADPCSSATDLMWAPDGRVWAPFGIAEEVARGDPGQLVAALAGLGCPSRLLVPSDGDGRLFVDVPGGRAMAAGAVLCAAARSVHGTFGLRTERRSVARRGAWAAAAEALFGELAAVGATRGASCAVGGGAGPGAVWREVGPAGYLVCRAGDSPRYRACVVARPGKPDGADWRLDAAGTIPVRRFIWVRVARGKPSAAVVVDLVSGDLITLRVGVATLGCALRSRGWDVARPGSGQRVLADAMSEQLPHPWPPTSIFFPCPTP
jgi:hypothetical protein